MPPLTTRRSLKTKSDFIGQEDRHIFKDLRNLKREKMHLSPQNDEKCRINTYLYESNLLNVPAAGSFPSKVVRQNMSNLDNLHDWMPSSRISPEGKDLLNPSNVNLHTLILGIGREQQMTSQDKAQL